MFQWRIFVISCLPALVTCQLVALDGLGQLKGKEEVARGDVKYMSFLGIPYAQPPVGENRFRKPVPAKGWEGVKEAKNYASSCPQYPFFVKDKLVGNEDCLYLNVHTRSLDGKKPVIVYIHGGAFIAGSGHTDAKYMLEEDIVFVSLQYRLGVFGFLTTEDKSAPGNWGLHDQHLALKWVKQNIAKFGGNPEMITLIGMSAGGASVHYHLLSPQSDGLFHRALAMSGSALCWWANIPNQKDTAIQLANKVGCPSDDSSDLVECLRGLPMEDVMAAQEKLYSWKQGQIEVEPMNIWSPRPDVEAGEEAILPVDPTIAMSAGQIQPVPFLVGVAESEGAWRAAGYLYKDENMAELLKDFNNVGPLALGLNGQVREDEMEEMLSKIKRYYLSALVNEEDLEKRLRKTVSGLIFMLGDTMFNFPIDRMVKLHGNKEYAPVWLYQFNYKHNHSLAAFDLNNPGKALKFEEQLEQLRRPTHAHELSMLFPMFEDVMGPLSTEETKMSKKFVKLVVDFAIQGKPTQDGRYEMRDWKNVADGQLSYFVFGRYSASNMGMPFQQRMKWWSQQPVYWNKSAKKKEEEKGCDESEDGTCPGVTADDGSRYAENVEELSEEEMEEMDVEKIVKDLKDEL